MMTILIVDDCLINRILLQEILKAYDVNIILCENGLDVLNKITENVSLVFMDYYMPIITGDVCSIEIKKKYPKIPIVLVSAMDRLSSVNPIFDDVIYKPISTSAIREIMSKYQKH